MIGHRPLAVIIGEICWVRDYFAHHAKDEPSFLPELRIADEVVALLQGGAVDSATRERVRASIDGLDGDHYDGTGWHHFRSLVREWLEAAEAEP